MDSIFSGFEITTALALAVTSLFHKIGLRLSWFSSFFWALESKVGLIEILH